MGPHLPRSDPADARVQNHQGSGLCCGFVWRAVCALNRNRVVGGFRATARSFYHVVLIKKSSGTSVCARTVAVWGHFTGLKEKATCDQGIILVLCARASVFGTVLWAPPLVCVCYNALKRDSGTALGSDDSRRHTFVNIFLALEFWFDCVGSGKHNHFSFYPIRREKTETLTMAPRSVFKPVFIQKVGLLNTLFIHSFTILNESPCLCDVCDALALTHTSRYEVTSCAHFTHSREHCKLCTFMCTDPVELCQRSSGQSYLLFKDTFWKNTVSWVALMFNAVVRGWIKIRKCTSSSIIVFRGLFLLWALWKSCLWSTAVPPLSTREPKSCWSECLKRWSVRGYGLVGLSVSVPWGVCLQLFFSSA